MASPCPSCGGTGWAVVFLDPRAPLGYRHAVAQGVCRCRGGTVWVKPLPTVPTGDSTGA